jgi:hypothetical protein
MSLNGPNDFAAFGRDGEFGRKGNSRSAAEPHVLFLG